jgi:hypothetical protein
MFMRGEKELSDRRRKKNEFSIHCCVSQKAHDFVSKAFR